MMNSINSALPLELIQLIFSKFPIVNLPNCRLVCKVWNNFGFKLQVLRSSNLIFCTYFSISKSPLRGFGSQTFGRENLASIQSCTLLVSQSSTPAVDFCVVLLPCKKILQSLHTKSHNEWVLQTSHTSMIKI